MPPTPYHHHEVTMCGVLGCRGGFFRYFHAYLGKWASFNGESSFQVVGDTCRRVTGRYVRGDVSSDFCL
jgi:hypothetical protein